MLKVLVDAITIKTFLLKALSVRESLVPSTKIET